MKIGSCETRNKVVAVVFCFKFLASLSHLALGKWEVLVGKQAKVECRGYPSGTAWRIFQKGYGCGTAVNGGQCDSALGLEVHWRWLTKPGPGWASGAMEGACWRCTLPPA